MNGFHCRAQTVEKFTGMRPRHTPGGNFNPPLATFGFPQSWFGVQFARAGKSTKIYPQQLSGPAPTDGQRSGRR